MSNDKKQKGTVSTRLPGGIKSLISDDEDTLIVSNKLNSTIQEEKKNSFKKGNSIFEKGMSIEQRIEFYKHKSIEKEALYVDEEIKQVLKAFCSAKKANKCKLTELVSAALSEFIANHNDMIKEAIQENKSLLG